MFLKILFNKFLKRNLRILIVIYLTKFIDLILQNQRFCLCIALLAHPSVNYFLNSKIRVLKFEIVLYKQLQI